MEQRSLIYSVNEMGIKIRMCLSASCGSFERFMTVLQIRYCNQSSKLQETIWCPEEDSNLHTRRHMDLNHARLPIPPSGQCIEAIKQERKFYRKDTLCQREKNSKQQILNQQQQVRRKPIHEKSIRMPVGRRLITPIRYRVANSSLRL